MSSFLVAPTILRVRGDLFGGLTAGVVALPLALAFGVSSGLGPAAGLYGAIALGLVAAILGGTPTQVSGPTGPMTVVVAAGLVTFGGDPLPLFSAIMLAGLIQAGFGLANLGRYVRYIPYPVISGFMSGIGIIIILLQLHPLAGGPAVGSPLDSVLALSHLLGNLSMPSLLLSGLTLGIVFITPARITRSLPSPLIALLAGTGVSMYFGMHVATIGEIPHSLPTLQLSWPGLVVLSKVLPLAIALALLGTIDTLLTSIVADSLTKDRHEPRRELIAQGAGNFVAGMFGGLPGAGATMRTVVNIKAGGTTRLSGVVHAMFLITVLLGLGPLAANIPQPVLAGILVKVGVDILDYRMLRRLRTVPRHDLVVMLAVFGVTVFVDLIVAVGVGVTLASLLLTYRMAKQTDISILGVESSGERSDAERALQDETDYGVRIIRVRGAFFFGSAAQMQDMVSRLVGARVVIINCLDVPFMDISAIFAMSGLMEDLEAASIRSILVLTERHKAKVLGVELNKVAGFTGIYTRHQAALDAARNLAFHRMPSGAPTSVDQLPAAP